MKIIDKTGLRFGRLTVLSLATLPRKTRTTWLCQCDCGERTFVKTYNLGKTVKSCGCLQRDIMRAKLTKHGHSPYHKKQSREYKSWQCMKLRCCNPHNNRYHLYGARGITVCERWLNSFVDFLSDMGLRPPNTSLDRIDVKGNYEPGNCRWATPQQQAANRTTTVRILFNGRTYCAAELARLHGVHTATFTDRLRHGWAVERAINPKWGGKV